jgi:hypothetical protein
VSIHTHATNVIIDVQKTAFLLCTNALILASGHLLANAVIEVNQTAT